MLALESTTSEARIGSIFGLFARGGEKIRQIRRFEDRIKSGPFLLRERINF
jgi:hypothetical protein